MLWKTSSYKSVYTMSGNRFFTKKKRPWEISSQWLVFSRTSSAGHILVRSSEFHHRIHPAWVIGWQRSHISHQQDTGGRNWLQSSVPAWVSDMDHVALTAARSTSTLDCRVTADIPVSCNVSPATRAEPASLLSPALPQNVLWLSLACKPPWHLSSGVSLSHTPE